MMTIDLKAIRERADAASPGPWREGVVDRHLAIMAGPRNGPDDFSSVVYGTASETTDANTEFILHVREDVPALLDLVDDAVGALLDAEVMTTWGLGTFERTGAGVAPFQLVGAHNAIVRALTRAGYPDGASRDAERVARERAKGFAASVHEIYARAFEAGSR